MCLTKKKKGAGWPDDPPDVRADRPGPPGTIVQSWGAKVESAWVTPTTIWLFKIAMENGPFIDDFPIEPSIYKGFSMAMLNNQMVVNTIWQFFTQLWTIVIFNKQINYEGAIFNSYVKLPEGTIPLASGLKLSYWVMFLNTALCSGPSYW